MRVGGYFAKKVLKKSLLTSLTKHDFLINLSFSLFYAKNKIKALKSSTLGLS